MSRHFILAALLMLAKMVTAQITYATVFADFDSARTYKNLKLIPIKTRGMGAGDITAGINEGQDIISLRQAMEKGLVTISERGTTAVENVHWLRVNNKSDKAVYISSGEVVMGGRQDRMVTRDTIMVPTGKDQYIPVMCVEEDRWGKEKKFTYSNYANPRLRRVLDSSTSQVLVWREVYQQIEASGTHAPTMAYLARRQEKKLAAEQNDYMKFFLEKLQHVDTTVLGFVCISGDKIIGCDVFTGRNLFDEEVEPLLAGYVEEAMAFGKAPTVKDEVVKHYLDKFLSDEKGQEQYCKKNGKLFKYKKRVFHLTAYAE